MASKTVADLMTEVVETVGPSDGVLTAARGMRLGSIRHLPVVDESENLVGLVTHSHIVAALTGQGRAVAGEAQIDSIMERDVVSIEPTAAAVDAARIIEKHKFGCLPVVRDGKLIGIITDNDFVRLAREFLEAN